MTLIWNIIQSVITILEIRVCVWMMEKFAEPRYSGKKQNIVVWIVTLGVGGVYAFNRWTTAYYSRAIILICLALLCIASLLLFTYHRITVGFLAANYLLIGGLLDLVIMSSAEIMLRNPGMFISLLKETNIYRMGVILCSKAFLFLFCWIACKKMNKRVIYQLRGGKIVLICVFLCMVEYIGVHILTEILSFDLYITYDLLVKLVFCLILIFLILTIVGISVLYYDKKDQLRQREIFLESLKYENQRVIRLYRERESMYHDFKNHLLALDSFVQNDDFEEYKSYLEHIKKPFIQKAAERKVGHSIMDLILNYKIGEAESKDIQVKCRIWGYIDFVVEITDEDACSLLGNLWDNAIEACLRSKNEEKWIDFQMRIRTGKILIEISNPYSEIIQDGSGNIQTIKVGKGIHGVGMKTIQDITERYHGYYNYVLQDHVFKTEVMICNK